MLFGVAPYKQNSHLGLWFACYGHKLKHEAEFIEHKKVKKIFKHCLKNI